MSSGSALLAGRRRAESLHTDTYTVYRRTGNKVTDPVTLIESDEFAVIHADIAGKFQFPDTSPQDVAAAGVKTTKTSMAWHTSMNVLGVLTDDEVLCTAVGPFSDPDLVGVRVRISGPFLKSHLTARRFYVEQLS